MGRKRYTPIAFMSKPKPMMSEEQLMEEIMLGTRELQVPVKPLSANTASVANSALKTSPTPQPKSLRSTASTTAESESRSDDPSDGSNKQQKQQVANKIPPAPALISSTIQRDKVSPMSTPNASPTTISPKPRTRRARPGKSPGRTSKSNVVQPPVTDNGDSEQISAVATSGSAHTSSPMPHSRRSQYSRSPVSARRRASSGNRRSLSTRNLQPNDMMSPLPPPPPLPTKGSEDDDQLGLLSPKTARRGGTRLVEIANKRLQGGGRTSTTSRRSTKLPTIPMIADATANDQQHENGAQEDSLRSRASDDAESLAKETSNATRSRSGSISSAPRSPAVVRRKMSTRSSTSARPQPTNDTELVEDQVSTSRRSSIGNGSASRSPAVVRRKLNNRSIKEDSFRSQSSNDTESKEASTSRRSSMGNSSSSRSPAVVPRRKLSNRSIKNDPLQSQPSNDTESLTKEASISQRSSFSNRSASRSPAVVRRKLSNPSIKDDSLQSRGSTNDTESKEASTSSRRRSSSISSAPRSPAAVRRKQSRRSINTLSATTAPLNDNGTDQSQADSENQGDSFRSRSSNEIESLAKQSSLSTSARSRSSSISSAPRSPGAVRRRLSRSKDPKRRSNKVSDELRESRRMLMQRSQSSNSIGKKKNAGYIKSFLGTSERSLNINQQQIDDSGEKNVVDDEAKS
ncbi:unnamed protein product [Cylindrotheca closterium]|uniref:Uncharacterized protein n=1 Tax=Cylindrotheca closterium TaxID=2856 RepID=A0AAD2CMF7_9STRA|nr:unnamed protein product [Cylindrotheca closterium]